MVSRNWKARRDRRDCAAHPRPPGGDGGEGEQEAGRDGGGVWQEGVAGRYLSFTQSDSGFIIVGTKARATRTIGVGCPVLLNAQ